jgi:hypothetical protein
LTSERIAQQALRDSKAIGLGGIEKVNSQLERLANRSLALFHIKLAPVAAKGPSSKGDAGHTQICLSQPNIFHGGLSPVVLFEDLFCLGSP